MTAPSFEQEVAANIEGLGRDADVQALSRVWIREIARHRYAYNFSWLGRPLIQFPQDIVALQQLVWAVRPDLIIETGIAHGGSLVLSASLLAMLDYADAEAAGTTLDPKAPRRTVLGVDIEIRAHNRAAILAHPFASRIRMIEGSSIAPDVVAQVRAAAAGKATVLVCLDSNHTADHVLAELLAYAPLVSPGSYCIVYDTLVEWMPGELAGNRPWGPGNSPMTAVDTYLDSLATTPVNGTDGSRLRFDIDRAVDHQLLISAAPRGFLRRVPADEARGAPR